MKRVLHLISHLNGGTARQLQLLAASVTQHPIENRVCILGRDDGRHGVSFPTIESSFLGWTRLIDPQPILKLRGLLETTQPDVIHAWDRRALRTGVLALRLLPAGLRSRVRLVASDVIVNKTKRRGPAWPDRLLLRRLDCLIAHGTWEVAVYRAWGIPDSKVVVIAPAIALDQEPQPADAGVNGDTGNIVSWRFSPSNRREGQAGGDHPSSVPPFSDNSTGAPARASDSQPDVPSLPPGVRYLACVGEVNLQDELIGAVWAFDILKCVHHDLHLLVIGNGPERVRLLQLARGLRAETHVHFVPRQPQLGPLLTLADALIVPGSSSWAVQSTLEAMAVARPVVAFAHPCFDGLIQNDETGYLVTGTNKAALAKKVHALLEHPERGSHMGAAGRARAERLFAPARMAEDYAALYEGKRALIGAA